ncbi:methionine--tRNA ligase [bacterium]|nr:methionine--tRNA ligase [bacterium]
MPGKTYYVTTPIYYVNADPHLGHAYTTIMCDILRRYYDLLGYDTYFLTGTDEYGQNIMRVAQQSNRDVKEMVDANSAKFRALWPQLNITNDDFIRTTEERHSRVVQAILQRTYDNGDIYMAEYGGNYCVRCERFYTDKETEQKPGFCPIHETELEHIKEKNYFFRLSKYQDWLRERIESDRQFLAPNQFRNEVLALLRDPLDDLCISRPVERLHWGIPLPFDDKFVTYVWYDALVNYMSALGYPDDEKFQKYWPETTHMIAKDILRQHAVYWPCFLKAAEIPTFKRLRVHGWWTVEGKKMSKSLGNVIDPVEEANKWGLDVFRYFVAREMTFGSDGDYSAKSLVARNNAELADDLGNLLSRVTAMVGKYCEGALPALSEPTDADQTLLRGLNDLIDALPGHLENCTIHSFLAKVNQVVTLTNRYITEQAPWAKFKAGETDRVGTILAVASQMLIGAGHLLYPVMPERMAELLEAFGLGQPESLENTAPPAGNKIQPAKPLFPQLEYIEPTLEAPESQAAPVKPEIAFEDFAKVDLRIATVLEAEPVPKTDKLLRLTIDLGMEKRQIVAGIAQFYKAEEMIGRQIVVVANLAPRKLRGLESKGMLLAGRDGETAILLGPGGDLPAGSEVS